MLIEGITTLVILSALFLVAPGVLSIFAQLVPTITAAQDAGLNAAQANIKVIAPSAINLGSVGMIMLGIGIMIGGFLLIRNYK
jgi:hypothetical protein